jgi:integrase/recombinase XerD
MTSVCLSPTTVSRSTAATWARPVKRYLKQAGIEVTGSCHLFRHAMAAHMLENGADIRFIQAMLGHGDISGTQVYTQVSVEKLRAVHIATHPRGAEAEGII